MVKRLGLALLVSVLAAGTAAADHGPFGLGIQAGEPSGVSGKLWLSQKTAVDGVVAWSFTDNEALHVQSDFLMHANVFSVDRGALPLYYGIGGRIKFEDDDSRVGVRVPVGLAYMFETAPVDIYLEVAPILDVTPDTDFSMNGGLGLRYFFN